MKKNTWIYGLVFISITFFLSSCIFYKTVTEEEVSSTTISALASQKQYVTIQEIGSNKVYLINEFNINQESVIGQLNLSESADHPVGANLYLRKNGKESKSFLHLYTNKSLQEGAIDIPISDIEKIESHKGEFIATFLVNSLFVAAGVVVAAVAFVAIACSCPHVAIINPDGTSIFQGSLFPGSIFKSLKRKDYLVLNEVQADKEGIINVQIFNDLDEVQYIDQVEMLGLTHEKAHVGLINNIELMAYNVGEMPLSATTQIDRNIDEMLALRDDQAYNFDDPASEESLNSVELSFNTEDLGEKALLVIRGKQTELLEHTAEVFFQQFGTNFPIWVERMNNADPTNYNQNAIDQGIALNAYIKENDKWKYIGNYNNVGAMAQRDLAIQVDLSKSSGIVEIKLEAAYGFWSIDQITLTSDWTKNLKMESLDLVSAINQDEEDVAELLENEDNEYVVQKLKGTSTNLKFKAKSSRYSTYVLSGIGYYNHERNYTNAPNNKFLRKMQRMDYSTHNLAQMVQLYQDMHLASNQ